MTGNIPILSKCLQQFYQRLLPMTQVQHLDLVL